MAAAVPTVAALANGGFVVSWIDASGTLDDSNGISVKAQIFNPSNGLMDMTAPALTVTAIAPDSGTSATDGLTDVATVAVSGTIDAADAGLTVAVYDGATLVGTTTADAGGNWSSAGVMLSSGANSLTAQATDGGPRQHRHLGGIRGDARHHTAGAGGHGDYPTPARAQVMD